MKIVSIFLILSIFTIAQIVWGDTLSLYHYSGTTFLDLPRSDSLKKNPVDLKLTTNFQYYVPFTFLKDEILKITAKRGFKIVKDELITSENCVTINKLKWATTAIQSLLNQCTTPYPFLLESMCCVSSIESSSINSSRFYTSLNESLFYFYSTEIKIGFILSSKGKIEFSPIVSPVGDNELKGWILKDEDYEDLSLNKPSEILNEIIDDIRTSSFIKLINHEIEYVNWTPNPVLISQIVYSLIREENRAHELFESNFKKSQDDYSINFEKRLKNILETKRTNISWNDLYDVAIREIASNILASLTEYTILPYNNTINEQIANHTYVHEATLKSIYPYSSKDLWNGKLSLDQIERVVLNSPIPIQEYPIKIFDIIFQNIPSTPVVRKLRHFFNSKHLKFTEFSGSALISLKRAKGLYIAVHLFGHFVADEAIVQVSNVELQAIESIRYKLINNQEPIIFKYSTLDPEKCPNVHNEDYIDIKDAYKKGNVVYGFIATNVYGLAPLVIPGESIIYHQRTEHRFNIMARFNPALVNYNIAHLLENKYIEFKYWETYCPGIIPRIAFLPDLLPKNIDLSNGVPPDVFMDSLNKAFPNGWVAKGIWDYNSVGKLVTHMLNITAMVESYRKSTFESFVKDKMSGLAGCEPIEDLNDVIKNHQQYMGWKIDSMLRIPHDVLVQELINIEEEQRVECNIGHCPQFLMLEDKGTDKKPKYIQDYYRTSIHTKFMECMNNVPEKLRGIPLTSDVAITPSGEVYFLETNPGGNSWLLSNDIKSLQKHNDWLRQFPNLIRNGKSYYEGMTPIDQMKFINSMMKTWNISVKVESPRFKFLRDRIIDVEHVIPYDTNYSRVTYTNPPPVPLQRVHPEIRNSLMSDAIGYFLSIDPTNLKKDKIHYVSALVNFMFYKEVHPDFYIRAFHLVERSRVIFREDFRQPLLNKLENFDKLFNIDVSASKNIILDSNQKELLGHFIMGTMEDLIDLQTLDIPHEDLRLRLNNYFDLFNSQNISTKDLDTLLFRTFTIWNDSMYNSILLMIRSQKVFGIAVQGGYQLLQTFLTEFIDVMGAFYAMERTGYKINNFDPKKFYQLWLPKIRELYTMEVFDWENPSDNQFVNFAAVELIYTVTHILYQFADYSMFKLNSTVFAPELAFLKKVVPYVVKGTQDVDLVGEVLDCLMLLSKEKDIQEQLFLGHDFIKSKQDPTTGGFPQGDDIKASLHATHTAITALVDHDYTHIVCCDNFGDMIDFNLFRDTLRFYGLMNVPHHYYNADFLEENRNFDYIDDSINISELPVIGIFNHTIFDHQYMRMRLDLYRKKILKDEDKRKYQAQKLELFQKAQLEKQAKDAEEKAKQDQLINEILSSIKIENQATKSEFIKHILQDELAKIEERIKNEVTSHLDEIQRPSIQNEDQSTLEGSEEHEDDETHDEHEEIEENDEHETSAQTRIKDEL